MATLFSTYSPIGDYVMYKGDPYIIVSFDGSLVILLNPDKPKLQVRLSLVEPMLNTVSAVGVEHKGHRYLVTTKGKIVSLTTHRFIKWGKHDGNYKAIIEAAGLHI